MPPRIHAVTAKRKAAFSLVELLSVIAIIAMMSAASGPMWQSFVGAKSVEKAVTDMSGVYETARTYAMAHHTYTRVGIAQAGGDSKFALPSLVIATIYSVDSSLTYDDSASMSDNTKWRWVDKPRVLRDLWIYNSLEGSSPSTSGDAKPSDTDIASFARQAGNAGSLTFGSIIQFNPAGEARVLKTEPARYIKIGVDQPLNSSAPQAAPRNRNPFILRLSGINGTVNVIRKENIL